MIDYELLVGLSNASTFHQPLLPLLLTTLCTQWLQTHLNSRWICIVLGGWKICPARWRPKCHNLWAFIVSRCKQYDYVISISALDWPDYTRRVLSVAVVWLQFHDVHLSSGQTFSTRNPSRCSDSDVLQSDLRHKSITHFCRLTKQ